MNENKSRFSEQENEQEDENDEEQMEQEQDIQEHNQEQIDDPRHESDEEPCAAIKCEDPGGVVNWVQCDHCDRWYHQICTKWQNGEFKCQSCKIKETKENKIKPIPKLLKNVALSPLSFITFECITHKKLIYGTNTDEIH